MNIKPKQYAIALFESMKDAEKAEQEEVIRKFVSKLADNNDISKLEPILGYFEDLFNKSEGIVEAEIVSAYDLGGKTLDILKVLVSDRAGAERVAITERKDKGLLGGVVLRYGDRSLDLSLSRKLEGFKRQITNS